MTTNFSVSWVPIVVSIFALAISLFSLWRTFLAPFNLNITIGSPTFRLYEIEPETSGVDKIWWIPSVDIPVSFVNSGAKPGKIFDARLIFRSKEVQKLTEEFFYPVWIVEYPKFSPCGSDRFRWIKEAIESEWYPLVLLPNQTVAKHLVLESPRWDHLLPGNFEIDFDIYSDYKSKWLTYQTFELRMDDWTLKELEKGCSFSLTEPSLAKIRHEITEKPS
jgi:hypothetical protein